MADVMSELCEMYRAGHDGEMSWRGSGASAESWPVSVEVQVQERVMLALEELVRVEGLRLEAARARERARGQVVEQSVVLGVCGEVLDGESA